MSGRLAPWKPKPPDGFEARVEAALSRRMFLLQECGPTSFLIKVAPEESSGGGDAEAHAVGEGNGGVAGRDEGLAGGGAEIGSAVLRERRRRLDDKRTKFKVQVGSTMGCSCRSKEPGPCIHLLFVLVKLLRVPIENPYLWQASLLDNEVDQILRGRYQVSTQREQRRQAADTQNSDVQRKAIDEGDVCAICQEELEEEGAEPTTFCKQGCGNSVHAKCMKVWAEHKQSTGEKVTCPFCREDWGPLAVEDIKKTLRQARRPTNVHFGVTCSGCRSAPVSGTRFRCVACADLDLCETCFSRGAHPAHPFISRATTSPEENWVAAIRPGAGGVRPGGLDAEAVAALQERELTVKP